MGNRTASRRATGQRSGVWTLASHELKADFHSVFSCHRSIPRLNPCRFVPGPEGIFPFGDIGNVEVSPITGDSEEGMVEDVEVSLHPRMGVAPHVKEAWRRDPVSDVKVLIPERQGESKYGSFLQIGMDNM